MVKKKLDSAVPGIDYPLSYREKDTQALAEIIKKRETVCLVAMKKVGISNFVRFFAHHPGIKKKYFGTEREKYLFVYCDLNDLLEISLRSFWVLVFKRVAETVAATDVAPQIKKQTDRLFLQAVPAVDPFFFFDNLKKVVELIATQTDRHLAVFLVRFDRLKRIFTSEFFANLQSLFDVAKFRFFYITTSVRSLPELYPQAFEFASLSSFAHPYFLKPAEEKDREATSGYLKLTKAFTPNLDEKTKQLILDLGGGHLMLTRLILIAWIEWKEKNKIKRGHFLEKCLGDERVSLACEEIWENLTPEEKTYLIEGLKGAWKSNQDVAYLFQTGILKRTGSQNSFFSPLFQSWVEKKLIPESIPRTKELTKKEELLFDFLLANEGTVCHRDEIITAVWPEYQNSDSLTVSDWAIDRLVARVRKKLKIRNDPHRILTIRGRGHQLLPSKT